MKYSLINNLKEFHVATGAELRSIIQYEIANGMVVNDTASYAILMEDVIEAMTVEALRYSTYCVYLWRVYTCVYVCIYVYGMRICVRTCTCMRVCALSITAVYVYTTHHTNAYTILISMYTHLPTCTYIVK